MRLFIALIPPPMVRRHLLATMTGVDGARWQVDAQLHLTLAFLGDVNDARAAALNDALSAQRGHGLTMHIGGVGAFDDRGRPTSLWARAEPDGALAALAARVSRVAEGVGITVEHRRFIPHVTLARLNRSSGTIDGWLADHAALSVEPWPVDSVHLMQSRLHPDGARYSSLADYRL